MRCSPWIPFRRTGLRRTPCYDGWIIEWLPLNSMQLYPQFLLLLSRLLRILVQRVQAHVGPTSHPRTPILRHLIA